MKKFPLIVLLFLIPSGFLLFIGLNENSSNPAGITIDHGQYPVIGVDFSHHSGDINFNKLREDGVSFVFLKATEGSNHKDSRVDEYFKEASRNEIPVGFYHFYRFEENSVDQFKFFHKTVSNKKYSLPLVLDVEDYGQNSNKTRSAIRRDIKTFVDSLESVVKCEILIYTNESGYNDYIKGNVNNDIWICSFDQTEKIGGNWKFWQYSHHGKLKYVDGWVDYNTFNGSKKQFQKYLNEFCSH
jgi:lysozyme